MRNLTWLVVAVVVVALALPAAAGEITVGKRALPPYAHIGDTITYQMWVENPNNEFDLRVDWTWDYLAPGTPDEVDTEPVVPPALPYTLTPLGTPGARQEYSFTAVITEDMLVPHPTEPPGTFAVINTFGARGVNLYDPFPENCEGEVDAVVTILSPCIRVHKDVDCDKSKEGDEVTYTICVVNCGTTDLLNLYVDDTILDLTGLFPTSIAVGESLCVDVPYTIPAGAPDPLMNEVTASGEDDLGFLVTDTDFAEVDLVHPSFEVFGDCSLTDPVPPGGNAEFEITIDNTGDCDLVVTTDPAITPPPGTIPAGGSATGTVTVPDPGGVDEICLDLMAYWTLPPDQYPCEMTNTDSMPSNPCCPVGSTGEEGCTPGFWKNHHDCWCEDFAPTDRVDSVFTIPAELSELADDTLADALMYKGGSEAIGAARNLLRHAVSAILNACSDDIDYPMTVAEIVSDVNAALATLERDEMLGLGGLLDMYNNYGCSIDAHCNPVGLPDFEMLHR